MIEAIAVLSALVILVLIVDTLHGMYCAWRLLRIESELKAIDEALATGRIDASLLRRIRRRHTGRKES